MSATVPGVHFQTIFKMVKHVSIHIDYTLIIQYIYEYVIKKNSESQIKLIFEFGSLILLIRGIFSILNDSAVTERKLPPRCPGQGYVNFLLSRTALR